MNQYVDCLTGNIVSLYWAAKEYNFSGLKEPLSTGVLDYCNLAVVVDTNSGDVPLNTATKVNDQWVRDYRSYTSEELAAQTKVTVEQAISNITVTTVAGNTYDGDKEAQNAMSRAIAAAVDDTETTPWKLADNSWVQVNRVELKEALRLAGLEQTNIMQNGI